MNNLLGIGMIAEKIARFATHAHLECWEIVCYLEGDGEIVLDGVGTPFERGTIILIPPRCRHEERCAQGFRNYHFTVKDMDFPYRPAALRDTPTHSVEQLLGMLYQEFHLGRSQGAMLCQRLLDAVMGFLHALLPAPEEGRSLPVERAKAILIHNLSNPEFQLEPALAPLGLSMGYLRRLFKAETGETPHEYLVRLRLAHARQLLSHDRMGGVGTVAALCGFQDPYYFSRLFRRHTGVSPSQWRSRNGSPLASARTAGQP